MYLHDGMLSVQHTERQRAAHHGRTEHDVWRANPAVPARRQRPLSSERGCTVNTTSSREVGPAVLECLAAEERSQIGCSSRAQGHLSRCDEHEVLPAADVAGLALSRAVAHWYRL